MYTSGGPFVLLAPTDAAFAAMPKALRDTLLADPKALANLLLAHSVAAYVPPGALVEPFRLFNNLAGGQIRIDSIANIDGLGQLGDFDSIFVANGTRVHPINQVLMTPP